MGIKLVIVDDAPFIREVIKHIVAGTEILVVGEATDGAEAVQIVQELKPDVVLMDLVMPKKSGIEATRELVEKNSNLRVIACSTVDQEIMIMKALEAGCCNYIVKPFTPEDILKAVRSAAQQGGM